MIAQLGDLFTQFQWRILATVCCTSFVGLVIAGLWWLKKQPRPAEPRGFEVQHRDDSI